MFILEYGAFVYWFNWPGVLRSLDWSNFTLELLELPILLLLDEVAEEEFDEDDEIDDGDDVEPIDFIILAGTSHLSLKNLFFLQF